jgi:hypothetical protein
MQLPDSEILGGEMKIKFGQYTEQIQIGLCFMWHDNHKDFVIDLLFFYIEITVGKKGEK